MSCKLEEVIKDIEVLATKSAAKNIAKELLEISNKANEELVLLKDRKQSENTFEKTSNGLGAVIGDELNNVYITDAEYKEIVASNEYYKKKHPEMFIYGDEYYYFTDDNKIQLIDYKKTNTVTKEMDAVYTAHEIKHALTYAYLIDEKNIKEVEYLKNAIRAASINLIDKVASAELKDRLSYIATRSDNVSIAAETVAILSSELNIRKEFIELFPQQQKNKLIQILDKIKAWLGFNTDPKGLENVIPTVDAIVAKNKKIKPIKETKHIGFGASKNPEGYMEEPDAFEYEIEDSDNSINTGRYTIVNQVKPETINQLHGIVRDGNRIINKILEWKIIDGSDKIIYTATDKKGKVYTKSTNHLTINDINLYEYMRINDIELKTKSLTNLGKPFDGQTRHMTLKSSEDMREKIPSKKFEKFKKLEDNIHGNPEKMLELLKQINDLDGTKSNDMDELISLLKEMDPKFFTKMNMYIRDNAAENGGIIDNKNIAINISKVRRLDGNKQSAAEVYVHEIIHAYTRFGIEAAKNGDIKARRVLNKLEHIMKVAKNHTKWEHMLGDVELKDATDKQKADAKALYDYIFTSEVAEHEFIAHTLTNPILKKHMKQIMLEENVKEKSLWESIKSIWDYFTGVLIGDYKFNDKNANIHKATKELAFMFAEYNNRAIVEIEKRDNLINKLQEGFNALDQNTAVNLHNWMKKIMPEGIIEPKPKGKAAEALWFAKTIAKMIMDKDYRKITLTFLDQIKINGVSLLNQAGTISSIIRDFIDGDELSNTVDWLNVQSDKVDQSKMNVAAVTSDIITKAFSRELTKEEDEALTNILLDADVQSIMNDYTSNQLINILTNEEEWKKAITAAKHKLEIMDKKKFGWYVNQAVGLGYYMATGKAHYAQILNAWNIARGVGSESLRKADKNVVHEIDKIATLQALHHMDKADKKIIAELLKTESEGISTVLQTAKAIHKESMKTVLKGQETFAIKGYSKELFDDQVEIEVAPANAEAEMKSKGFKKLKDLKQHPLINTQVAHAIYVSTSYAVGDWNRASTRLTKNHTKGTSLKDIWYAEDTTFSNKKYIINKKRIDTKRYEAVQKMYTKEIDLTALDYGLSPVTDLYGSIVGYRVMMEKDIKKDLLKQNKRATDVLGATKATLLDKQRSKEHNKKVLELIVQDAKKNYIPGQTIGRDNSVYVLISAESTDAELKEIWDVMPPEFKLEALKNKEKGLPVRKDLLHAYFGFRELSFANMPLLKNYMPQMLKATIRIAEAIWKEFIKIAKVDILLKMPFVLVGNILSNMVYAVNTGSSPLEVIQMYVDSTRDVRNYLQRHRELIKLQELVQINKATNEDKDRIKILERELKNSSIHELYELGVYQAIVEDVSKEEMSSKNKIKQTYKNKIEKAPKIVKDGVNWLFLTEETQYYKFATEVLQMSDLVARDIENRKMQIIIKQQAKGKKDLPLWYIKHLETTHDEIGSLLRLSKDVKNKKRKMGPKEKVYFEKIAKEYKNRMLLNAFINYNKLSGPIEEYLNKMGFIMFTKYAKRIQRVILDTGTSYPLKSLMILFFDSYIWNMDTIQDQQILTRSWFNMTPQDPIKRIFDVFEPALVQNTTYRFY